MQTCLGSEPHRGVVRDQDIGTPVLTVGIGDRAILDINRKIWVIPVSRQDIRDNSGNFHKVNRTESGRRDARCLPPVFKGAMVG